MRRLLLLAALVAAAAAADDRRAYYFDRPVDFSLELSHHEFALDYGATTVTNSLDRVRAVWRERFTERLQLGLFGGYAWLTQRNNPATAGREIDGYLAGFLFDFDLYRSARFDSFVSAAWLYQKVDDDDGTEKVVIATREPDARVGVGFALDPRLRLYGGLRYGRIDGEQRRSGAVNETRAVQQTRDAGRFAGIELRLEGDGYVRVAAHSGSDRNVGVYFGRRF